MQGDKLLSTSVGVYRTLLRIYPLAHREAYGPLMLQLFRDTCLDACQQGGTRGLARLWMRTVRDVVSSVIVEYGSAFENGGQLNMDARTAKRRIVMAWILAGFPLGLGVVLSLVNPRYMRPMVVASHSGTQPLGWILTAGILLLAGLAYFAQRASIALASRATPRPAAGKMLSVGSVLFCFFPAMGLVFLGPALLRLVEAGILGPGS